jgi:hypothetical protein
MKQYYNACSGQIKYYNRSISTTAQFLPKMQYIFEEILSNVGYEFSPQEIHLPYTLGGWYDMYSDSGSLCTLQFVKDNWRSLDKGFLTVFFYKYRRKNHFNHKMWEKFKSDKALYSFIKNVDNDFYNTSVKNFCKQHYCMDKKYFVKSKRKTRIPDQISTRLEWEKIALHRKGCFKSKDNYETYEHFIHTCLIYSRCMKNNDIPSDFWTPRTDRESYDWVGMQHPHHNLRLLLPDKNRAKILWQVKKGLKDPFDIHYTREFTTSELQCVIYNEITRYTCGIPIDLLDLSMETGQSLYNIQKSAESSGVDIRHMKAIMPIERKYSDMLKKDGYITDDDSLVFFDWYTGTPIGVNWQDLNFYMSYQQSTIYELVYSWTMNIFQAPDMFRVDIIKTLYSKYNADMLLKFFKWEEFSDISMTTTTVEGFDDETLDSDVQMSDFLISSDEEYKQESLKSISIDEGEYDYIDFNKSKQTLVTQIPKLEESSKDSSR